MIFNRKIYDKLLKWKTESQGKKAILIEGARRIGKTTIALEFARNEYESFILIDFSKFDKTVERLFSEYLNDLDTFFQLLGYHFNTALKQRRSLIIFDEVQFFPQARSSIKHLVADGRFDYLETGSLISIRENVKDILIPSEELSLTMHPLDFEEFCQALGEGPFFSYIKDCFIKKLPLDSSLHRRAMQRFKEYMLVGGMPKPVALYIENNKSFVEADEEKRSILKLYRDDIMKIESRYRTKVLSIFDQIPVFLSQHEKRIEFRTIQKNSSFLQYEESFFWLADSMVANECFRCNDPSVGLSLNGNRAYIKCYMCDTGLLLNHAFDENSLMENEVYKQILEDKLSLNEGMLYENAIAQELVASGHKLYFYTHYNESAHRNDIEIDFLLGSNIDLKYKLYPIEVKSSRKYTTVSLEKFRMKYKDRIGGCYIIHPRNLLVKENGIICIPPYMAGLI